MAGRVSSAQMLKAAAAGLLAEVDKVAAAVDKAVKADIAKGLEAWHAENAAEVADMNARLDAVVRWAAPAGPVRHPKFGAKAKRDAERLEKIAYCRRMADEVDSVTRQGYLSKAAELEAEVESIEAARALVEREGR